MASTKVRDELQGRKRILEKQIAPLKRLEEELAEINLILSACERGGWERPGHDAGCRCHECDPSR